MHQHSRADAAAACFFVNVLSNKPLWELPSCDAGLRRSGILRIGRRAEQLQNLKRRVEQVRALAESDARYDSPEKDTAESDIRATVLEVFGPVSPEFLEHEYHRIWKGPMWTGMQPGEVQEGASPSMYRA